MAITLKALQKPKDTTTTIPSNSYVYKDLHLDLELNYPSSGELFKDPNLKDVVADYDVKAVLNSIRNLFLTSPGQKLLNPAFGIDLRRYLGDPVTETRAHFIGNHIIRGIESQEPRVLVDQVTVIAARLDQQYDISLLMSIPTLNIAAITLKGTLNSNGYTFVQ